jgi:DNA polymerase III epsilon subunit-like protein
LPFVLFDTETTGGGENDRICQIALGVLKKDGCDYYSDFCKPPLPISYGAMAVHGITEEDVADKPSFWDTDTAKLLNSLNTEKSVVIAHNAKFDIDMAKKEGIEWKGHVIDTFRCAKHLLKSDSYAMQYLRYSLGLYKSEKDEEYHALVAQFGDMMNAHNALFDIYVLKKLFFHLIDVAGDYKKLIELTSKPVLLETLMFGKHRGESFESVAKKDPSYLVWLRDNKKGEDTDLTYTIDYYLQGSC